jgi:Tol biopolymer transport system component
MKIPVTYLALVCAVVLGLSGCGSNGPLVKTPVTPSPTPTPTPSSAKPAFAFLRTDGDPGTHAARTPLQEHQAARRAAKIADAARRQAPMSADSGAANIYVYPYWIDGEGYLHFGTEYKVTDHASAYTSVDLSLNHTSIVTSAIVDGYNQIFTGTIAGGGTTTVEFMQLTTDPEHHWLPHASADGSRVVFTKFDPISSGDVLCLMDNAVGAIEKCLDFSSTNSSLSGARMWHASWTPDGKIVFEAWGGPLQSDEIFMVNPDGSGVTQITDNAGTSNYDECPSMFEEGTWMLVDTWNDITNSYDIEIINLDTKERRTIISAKYEGADGWDPLFAETILWVSQHKTDPSEQLYMMSYSPVRLTNNIYANYFASSLK